jgi:hypothetical protein
MTKLFSYASKSKSSGKFSKKSKVAFRSIETIPAMPSYSWSNRQSFWRSKSARRRPLSVRQRKVTSSETRNSSKSS